MDRKHLHSLVPGALVTVYTGQTISKLEDLPLMTATARVDNAPKSDEQDPMVWLSLLCGHLGELPQMYRLSEILGMVLRYDKVKVSVERESQTFTMMED